MKRILIMILTVVLALSLASCRKQNEPEPETVGEPESAYAVLEVGEVVGTLDKSETEELWQRLDGYWSEDGEDLTYMQFCREAEELKIYDGLADIWKLYGSSELTVSSVDITDTDVYIIRYSVPVSNSDETNTGALSIKLNPDNTIFQRKGTDGFEDSVYYRSENIPEVVKKPVIEYPQVEIPDNLPTYTPGTFQTFTYDVVGSNRDYRYVFYNVPEEYVELLSDKDQEEYRFQVECAPNACPAIYLDDPYYHPYDLPTQMRLKNFVAYYGISREDFDIATVKYAQRMEEKKARSAEELGEDFNPYSDEYEVPNGDIIYTFDDAIINAYYGKY